MYNYLGVLRKSTAIEHCVTCNFFDSKTPNLILSKNNRIEFYSLSDEETLIAKKYINIYGKIKILLTIPTQKGKDNLFILTQDLNFSLFSYDSLNNNINILISGSIKEDLGKIQDDILYCLDSNKNYIMICAYKNIFKIICVNIDMYQFDQNKNYTIRFQYEKILFLAPFYLGVKDAEKNVLNYIVIKQIYSEKDGFGGDNIELNKDIVMESIQIKIDNELYNQNLNKINGVSNGKVTSLKVNSKLRKLLNNNNSNNNEINMNNKNKNAQKECNIISQTVVYNYEKLFENVSFLEKIDVEDEQSINLILTHPDSLIVIFFSTCVKYYQYNYLEKRITHGKTLKYSKKRFINYITLDEKNYKYYIVDDLGNLFLFRFIEINQKQNDILDNPDMTLQLLGQVNLPSCMAYLNKNILFIGSIKGNSQLIKINENMDNNVKNNLHIDIDIIEEYESLAPISNMILLNNTKEENGIEIITVSGMNNNCSLKNIKKGTNIIYTGELDIKNITDVFKIIINNSGNKRKIKNPSSFLFIITTTIKSFIIEYDYKYKIISLNTSINFDRNEKVKFAKNIDNIIIIVTNIFIYIYQNNLKLNFAKLKINEKGEIPLLLKFNKKLNSLFIYYNNNNLIKYNIDINDGKIIGSEIILNNIAISSFDVCKKNVIFSEWDNNKIGVYSFNDKKIYYFDIFDEVINFVYISSIQIIKLNEEYNIFLSLSIGKLIWLKFKKQINEKNFEKEGFVIKQNYNLNLETFKIKKVKNNSNKCLFLDTTLPCLIYFNHDNLIISNFNANKCKDIIPIDNFEKNFLFVFNNKISFGSFSGNQNQNIYTLKTGKTINNIRLLDFSEKDTNKKINNFRQKKFILTIEEKEKMTSNNNISNDIGNIFINSSLVLNDLNMKEITRYNFEYENEISMNLLEIDLKNNDFCKKKYFVVGTGITDEKKSEPKIGHLYLIEINIDNIFSIKKLNEIELIGGVYAMNCYKNIIYMGIKDTLFIYSVIKKNHEHFYEFKLIRKHSEFDLINNIYVCKEIIYEEEEDEDDKENKKDKMIIEQPEKKEINEIYICDIYKSIILYRYDIINDKLKEISRNNILTWVYNIEQSQKNLLYLTDIDNNIITLKKLSKIKNEKEKVKLDQVSNFNLGERITSLISTEIQNKNLSSLTSNTDSDDIFEESKDSKNINDNDKVQVTYFGTMEGTVGYIIALNKHAYEFLYFLQEFLIKKTNMIGNFDYKMWRSFKDGYNVIESKGYIEGDIIKEFLNYDDDYKKMILKELNFPWKKSVKEVVNIIETLNNFY